MTSAVYVLSIVFLQACICRTALALPTPDLNISLLDQWLASFDPISKMREVNSVVCESSPDGFYPFPDQTCGSNYYACINCVQYNLTCPNGYVFDPNVGCCLSPETATCIVTTTTSTTTISSTTYALFQCSVDSFNPITACSSSFYACIGGEIYPQTCPGNGLFDSTVSACVSPDKLPLCAPIATTYSASILPAFRVLFPLPMLPSLPNSPIFQTTTSTTPPSKTISTSLAVPTFPKGSTLPLFSTSATIKPTAAILTTIPPATITDASFICLASEGFFAMPGKCSPDYFICVTWSPYVQTCPVGIFDPVLLKCVLPESASPPCTATALPTTTIPTTTKSTTPTTISTIMRTTPAPFVCSRAGQYPYPGSCTLYYVCEGGTYLIASCPMGQVFNPPTQFCEEPISPGCNFSFLDFHQGLKLVSLSK